MKIELLLKNSLIPFIGKTAKLGGFYFVDTFLEHNLPLSKEQWLLLKILHEKDGAIQNDLAIITDRSKTSLTRLIHTMEKKGLVYRVSSEKDKRINHIYLSETGKEIFQKSIPVVEKLINELQLGIEKEELEITLKVLEKVRTNIHKKIDPI